MKPDEPSVSQETADRQRIEGYLRGDPDTFREVDGWIRSEVLSCYHSLREDHEDVCQVVHEKVLSNLRGKRFHCRSSLRTYISGITHHTAIDRLRGRYRDRILVQDDEAEPADSSQNPYQMLASEEEQRLLHRAIHLSSAACRSLWRMVFLERLSYVEIGQRLSVPPGTVKSRSWHCRRKALAILKRLRLRAARGGGRETVRRHSPRPPGRRRPPSPEAKN